MTDLTDMARQHPVNISDVAQAAGVGESTVSRVVRNRGAVSSKTRARVEAAIARLGYVPNRIAGSLASTGSHLVAIVIPSLSNIVFPDILSGVESVLDEAGLQPVIGVTEYDMQREEKLIASMLSWRPAAVLVAGLEHTPAACAMLKASNVRIVELLDTDGEGLDIVVGFSNRDAGMASGRFLLGRNYRRIAYVGGDLARDTRAGKRFYGFMASLQNAGAELVDREFVAYPSSVEAGRIGLKTLLARKNRPDAVYFSNDDMAMGGYFHCLAHNIAVPAQLALMGHNGLDVGRFAAQPLTTVRTPRREIGVAAARLLLNSEPAGIHDLGFTLLAGATA